MSAFTTTPHDSAWALVRSCATAQPAKPLILTGPTASGKTGLALEWAQSWGAEIISADSALIYRGMNIGTAKPTEKERCAVPHHLIDILDPTEQYSAAQFVQDCQARIKQIQARRKWPLIVGGTMLYLKALREGLDNLPSADPKVRACIQNRAKEVGWNSLHAELQSIDPDTAKRLAPLDAQRISRALEVFYQTGTPYSSFLKQPAQTSPNAASIPMISLEPEANNRSWLHERIAKRFKLMLSQGLVDEVYLVYQRCQEQLALTQNGHQSQARDLPSMRCVGYRQVIDSIEGRETWDTLEERALAATRQLAKRQLTWLRGMERIVIHPDDSANSS